MTDVIQIAQERRAQLRAEIQKIEEFLRMAEMLTGDGGSAQIVSAPSSGGMDGDKGGNAGALRTNLFRQSGTGA